MGGHCSSAVTITVRERHKGCSSTLRSNAMNAQQVLMYGIETHKHRFAAWAASRAASVKNCRFTVEQGRGILEECGFTIGFCRPEQLPEPHAIDAEHRGWRADILRAARPMPFTHGVAA